MAPGDKVNTWEKFGMGVLGVMFVTAVIIVTTLIVKHKQVDSYYASLGSNNGAVAVCIQAHWDWHPDEKVFCTDDIDKAVRVLNQLNSTVK